MDGGDPRRSCPGRVVRIRWCGAKHSRLGVALRSRVVERGIQGGCLVSRRTGKSKGGPAAVRGCGRLARRPCRRRGRGPVPWPGWCSRARARGGGWVRRRAWTGTGRRRTAPPAPHVSEPARREEVRWAELGRLGSLGRREGRRKKAGQNLEGVN
jgi:hypothetical protein